MKKAFKVKEWSHLIIEGYCMINLEYQRKSSKYMYTFDADKDIKDWEKVPNSRYDPTVKPVEKPDYCEGHVCVACLNKGEMCQYFNYCDVEPELHRKFVEMWKKEPDKDEGDSGQTDTGDN